MLHRFSIDLIVLLVRTDKLYKARLPLVVDGYNQSILVSCDVEDHSTALQNARRSKLRL
jgi:hypothetical protein